MVLRYLGNETGMKGLQEWRSRRERDYDVGPVPVPLTEWDYKIIRASFIGKSPRSWRQADKYIYALAIDKSPTARAVLNELIKTTGKADESLIGVHALKLVQERPPADLLTGENNLAKLTLANAFFVDPSDRKYSSGRVIGFNKEKNKALIEIHVNRGALSEERYHVVLNKCERGWQFMAVQLIALS